jgi:hypothetical protein
VRGSSHPGHLGSQHTPSFRSLDQYVWLQQRSLSWSSLLYPLLYSVMEPSEEVLASLSGTKSGQVPSYTWESHIWSDAAFKNSYKEWVKARGPADAPKSAPSTLPPLPPGWSKADAGVCGSRARACA